MLTRQYQGFIRKFALVVSVLMLFSLILTGCGTSKAGSNPSQNLSTNSQTPPSELSENSSSPSSPAAPSSSVKVTLYFPTSDASGLVPVERTLTVKDGAVIQAIFAEFANPPAGLEKPLPEGTKLLDAKVKDGVAILNLSKSFKENFEGGSTGEQMVLYSIVNTLTSLSNVQSVEFLLEGEKKVAILGELDTTTPITRNESLIIKQ